MPFHLKNLFQLIPSLFSLQKNYTIQQQFTRQILDKYLVDYQGIGDGTLQKKDWRRMQDYPLQFVVFFADLWTILRQKPLSSIERERITLFAASGCLYDDFFDKSHLTESEILNIYLQPATYQAQTDKEKVFLILLKRMYQLFDNQSLTEKFKETFSLFFQAQIQSKKQLNFQSLNRNDLKKISFDKGGYALALSRLLMGNDLIVNELETVYELGAWYQVLDDIVDIATDYQDKIYTLATSISDTGVLENDLQTQMEKAFRMLRDLNYPKSLKAKVVYRFAIIGATGWVHLTRLKKLQKKSDQQFNLAKYAEAEIKWVQNRKENIWVALRFWLGKKY